MGMPVFGKRVQARRSALMLLFVALLQGCSGVPYTPAIPIFGSYFPAWIFCAVGGILVAIVLRFVFIALHIAEHLPAPPLVYLCFAVSAGLAIWLAWSGRL